MCLDSSVLSPGPRERLENRDRCTHALTREGHLIQHTTNGQKLKAHLPSSELRRSYMERQAIKIERTYLYTAYGVLGQRGCREVGRVAILDQATTAGYLVV